jgi:hypothetical protein
MAGERRTGRILSLGFPLPGAAVDNYNFLSAPSFFDYDALVVDPHALSALIEGVLDGSVEARTFTGDAVRNQPSGPSEGALAEVLLRRVDETRMLLERGGAVVVVAHPPATHSAIHGVDALDDYYWLPAPSGLAYAPPYLLPAEGTRIHPVDDTHPLSPFVASQLALVAYRARFELPRDAGRVYARSHGGAAVGVDLEVAGGRVVFLPALKRPPAGDDRYAVSERLQSGIRRLIGVMAEGRTPAWLRSYPVPGLAERQAALTEARAEVERAQAAVTAAEGSHDELARYQQLLWQEGALGLEPVVLDALKLIGFQVYASGQDGPELRSGRTSVLLEIDASERPVDMAPHHRLRQRIERTLERRGAVPRGLILVNGCRLQPPKERKSQVSDALKLASETMRYCVAPTSGLFEAVVAKLSGDDEAVSAYRERLLTTDGVLEPARTA